MINSTNYGLQECECGVSLDFPNPSGSLPKKDEYFLYFNVESTLPSTVPSTVTLTPQSYVISSNNSFSPKVIAKVESVHRGETQSLIRLSIKDRFNQILYTNYLKLICSPTSTVTIKGVFKSSPDNIGPYGGSLMVVGSTGDLDVGMSVTGTKIVESTSIVSIISDTVIELSKVIQDAVTSQQLFYTFTRTTNCIDPEVLRTRSSQSQYVVLDKSNNWTYTVGDQVLLKFIRQDQSDENISIIVPAKNTTILLDSLKKTDIPAVGMIYTSGRVNNDQYCIT